MPKGVVKCVNCDNVPVTTTTTTKAPTTPVDDGEPRTYFEYWYPADSSDTLALMDQMSNIITNIRVGDTVRWMRGSVFSSVPSFLPYPLTIIQTPGSVPTFNGHQGFEAGPSQGWATFSEVGITVYNDKTGAGNNNIAKVTGTVNVVGDNEARDPLYWLPSAALGSSPPGIATAYPPNMYQDRLAANSTWKKPNERAVTQ